jgi:hypothetical protein
MRWTRRLRLWLRGAILWFMFSLRMGRLIDVEHESLGADGETVWYVNVTRVPWLTAWMAIYVAGYESALRNLDTWGVRFEQVYQYSYPVSRQAMWGRRQLWCVGLSEEDLTRDIWEALEDGYVAN